MRSFFPHKIVIRVLNYKLIHTREVRVRFAPSPTGFLHLGGLRTALCNYLFAKKNEGKFILRIEDTDLKRKITGTAEHLNEILIWSGLIPDESPYIGGSYGPYIQSERLHLYKDAADQLLKKNMAYKCFCTKEEIDLRKKRNQNYGYDNKCRYLSKQELNEKLSSNLPYAVRFKLENKNIKFNDIIYGPIILKISESEGDPIILKSDGYPTYHLANVVDDYLMNISHILRGVEWQSSTPKHIMLYNAFSWPVPYFAHLPLALNPDGSKLSKRQNDIQVQYLKDAGYFPDAIINYIGVYTGGIRYHGTAWSFSLQELAEKFVLENVNAKSNRMEKRKLDICNHHHLLILSQDKNHSLKLVQKTKELVQQFFIGKNILRVCELTDEYVLRILKYYIKEKRISRLPELTETKNLFLWCQPDLQLTDIPSQLGSNLVIVLELMLKYFSDENEEIEKERILSIFNNICNQQSVNINDCMILMRKILSNEKDGPPLVDIIKFLGVSEVKKRIQYAIELVTSIEIKNGSRKAGEQG